MTEELFDFYKSRLSDDFIANVASLVSHFEGFVRYPYKPAGEKKTSLYTIGYGHYGVSPDIGPWSQDYAYKVLKKDLYSRALELARQLSNCDVMVEPGQFAALLDFVFNCGIGALLRSTLWKKVCSCAPNQDIYNEFRRWIYSGRTILKGLQIRAEYRCQLWKFPVHWIDPKDESCSFYDFDLDFFY